MLRQPLPFAYWLHKHLVSSFTSLFPIQSIRPLLATSPHYAAPVLLRGHHATLEVTSTPHPHFTASFTDLREHFLLSAVFFTLVSFLLLSRPPWGLHLYWSYKRSRAKLLFWITAIHKRGILVGCCYVLKASFEVRIPQPWNLPLIGFEPAFLKVPWVNICLSWRLSHRALWVLINK